MRSKMTVGARIAWGFGVVAAVVLVVAAFGFWGVREMASNADEVVAKNKLSQELTQREVDHLAWVGHVSALFTDDSISKLAVQTDDHKCKFGQWLYGEARAEAEAAIPELTPLLKKIEKHHADLHATAVAIGEQYRQPHHGLSTELARRLSDHYAWAATLGSKLLSQANADEAARASFDVGVQTDPTQCGFGRFLADPRTAELAAGFAELKQTLSEVRAPHEKLHASAIEVQRLVRAGDFAGAVAVFDSETKPALAQVAERFHTAIEAEEGLTRGAAAASEVLKTQTKPALANVQSLLGEIRTIVEARTAERNAATIAAASRTNWMVTTAGVGGTALGVLLAFLITRGIVRPLRRIITGLDEGADQVFDAADQVAKAAQQAAEASSEQASSLEETSASLEQVSAMTRSNADSSRDADTFSRKAVEAADRGGKIVSELNEAMQGISESSEQIGKITKVIEEIAFQTNLLALNAAVEAARAGEHGKGFAVVADEVRNLAQRAAGAANEIVELIGKSNQRSNDGVRVAANVGDAFGEILSSVRSVSELVSGIARASEEQSEGVGQVSAATSQMDRVTQQNAASAEESAAAAEQLSAQAASVKRTVDELAAMVGRAESATNARKSPPRAPSSSPAPPASRPPAKTVRSQDGDEEAAFDSLTNF